ncbi:tRNA (adenosine(37)-N6)-dimethylallyltransferase MiaA [Maricaulis salignorans]|uniref:tRNA dimethylallyltransferase n=1 Tax=Maricaulis salignorans TaxID=144026 RepID=A0A1G9SAR0_9PROT|nr:tRNA (adenosine(37)-N6)-dimethylallyltransferase MiaA [Maricaulis salignorans]SDM32593.1 tRNA dimethylallyltransferase [Maricaulis salignorans]
MTRCLLIAGPTAAGKTALALAAAEALDGEIINADSMQIYAGLPLITAQPEAADFARAPHHLFGNVDPGERWSVGHWTEAALALIRAIRSRGRTPILVGGTGLYFLALTKGLAPVPEIDPDTRRQVAELIAASGPDGLRREAERLDPVAAARIKPADLQRLGRIVEVGYATGEPLTAFHAETRPLLAAADWRGIAIEPERQALYDRIDRRFELMLEAGALDEARAFARLELDPLLPASKALGLPPLLAHLRGEIELDAAVSLAQRDSRRYAKRQLTWLRNQQADWPRIHALDAAAARDELAAILAG